MSANRRLFRGATIGAIAFAAGCSIAPGLEPTEERNYQLVGSEDGVSLAAACPRSLNIRPMFANSFLGSRKIVFGKRANERGFYQYAAWLEAPPLRLVSLLEQKLERSGGFTSISLLSSGARADLELSLELREFYHDISNEPGVGRVEVRAELLELHRRDVLASRTFTATAAARQYSSEGAVNALSEASQTVVADMTHWISDTCLAHSAASPGEGRMPSGARQQDLETE